MIRVPKKKLYRRKRAMLTITAVAISMSLLVSMLSVAQGIQDFTYSEIEASREDVVLTSPNRHGVSQGHTIRDELAEFHETREVLARLTDLISMNISGKKRFVVAEGVVPKDAKAFLPDKYLERFDGWFGVEDDPHFDDGNYTGAFTYEVLVSSSVTKDFGLRTGDTVNLSLSSNGMERTFTIKGVFDTDFSGEGVFSEYYFISLHLSELQTILGLDRVGNHTLDIVDSISMFLQPGMRVDTDRTKEFVEKVEAHYPMYKGYVITKEERLKALEAWVNLANGFNMGIGIVTVMIGLLFVACVMVISVYERTPIIGMMRAIGISKRTIFLSTFSDSLTIVTLGALIGLVPGYFIADLVGKYFSYSYGLSVYLSSFTPMIAFQSFGLTVLIGSAVSLLPAWVATRMDVILALKHIK